MLKYLIATFVILSTSSVAQLSERFDSLMRASHLPDQPGSALLVMSGNKIIYQNGYGLANVEKRLAITPKTNFRMASVSKQFTAMGILLLEKAGKLSLNDPLNRYLPEFTGEVVRKVKIRHMLTHSSGLLDYESVMNPDQREQLLDAHVLTLLKNRDTLYFEPGSQFRYSNSAYCLLALVIERVSGQSFATFLKERIFQPISMNQSVVYEAEKPIANRAMGYRKKDESYSFSDQSVTSATKGDGGVYTSLADYRKWITALHNATLLDLKAALLRTEQVIPNSSDSYYGAGWFFRHPTSPVLFHSGSTCGFNNYVITIPSKQFLMALFSNKANNKKEVSSVVKILTEAGYGELGDVLALDELTQ